MSDSTFLICLADGRRYPAGEVRGGPCPSCGGPLVDERQIQSRLRPDPPDALAGAPDEAKAAAQDPKNLFGDFVLVKDIGQGGHGAVVKAWQKSLGRTVALKFIRSDEPDLSDRFLREAQLAAKFSHPHIVPIHQIGSIDGRAYIAMEFIDGETLDRLDIEPREAVRLFRDAALAIQYAHEQGIVHRDLKPQNLIRDRRGHVWVMDFGIARPLARGATLTRTGVIVGTPAYMPPEQASGLRCDARSDVYGLGATFYEVLTGRPPIDAPTPLEILRRIGAEEPDAPRRIKPAIDRDLETILLKCVDKDRERRYPSAAALAKDLELYLNGEPILARPPSALYRFRKRLVKRKAIVAIVLLLAVLAAAYQIMRGKNVRLIAAQQERLRQMPLAVDAAMQRRRAGDLEGAGPYAREADRLCRQAIAESPGLAEPHYWLGRIRRAEGRDEEALGHQRDALSKDPGYAPAAQEIAALSARRYFDRIRSREQMLESMRQLKIALADPRAAHMRLAKGLVAWLRGDLDTAAALLQEASQEAPFEEESIEARAMLEMERGRFEESVRRWTAGLDRNRAYWPLRGIHLTQLPAIYCVSQSPRARGTGQDQWPRLVPRACRRACPDALTSGD
ncbi:MAG: protein kinase [Planctomycetes bacterium]|nr:protein kinase [Planctomycetota bacterium]